MKRIISFLLVIVLAISCFSLTAFASDENSKVSDSLSAKLEKLTLGEKIETIIWLYSEIDEDEIERKTFLDCGLTAGTCMTLEDVDLYKKTYNRILGEIQSEVNKSFVEKCGVDENDIVLCSTLSPMIILNLTEEKVYEIANFKEVALLDYDDSVPVEPSDPIEPTLPVDVVGDADQDGELSVLDATEIQLVLAELKGWENESAMFAADYDRDGDVSVLDATAIQLELANI
ncbi:MAG: hypothetical protein IJ433_06285 [Ruminococcus sp.]|nr:hypothetical protein [Ruminococcus sp.]